MVTVLAGIRARLAEAGIEDAAFEAAQLYTLATGRDAYLADDAPLAPSEQERLDALCAKRCTRYPLQYLCGAWDFMDLTLKIGPGVLIPRADTETVAMAAIETARAAGAAQAAERAGMAGAAGTTGATGRAGIAGTAQATGIAVATGPAGIAAPTGITGQTGTAKAAAAAATAPKGPAVADLCSGSGAIALAVARHVPHAHVTAVEISPHALTFLRANNHAYGDPLNIVWDDVFCWQNACAPESLDVIVSNPPYIAPEEFAALAPELAYEPRIALEAADGGLRFYRHIAPAYFSVLRPGGWLIFETGYRQADAVAALCRDAGYTSVSVRKDAGGNPRCVLARRPFANAGEVGYTKKEAASAQNPQKTGLSDILSGKIDTAGRLRNAHSFPAGDCVRVRSGLQSGI